MLSELKSSVANLLVASQGTIMDRVRDELAQDEVTRRAGILKKSFEAYNTAKKILDKASRPDVVTYVNGQKTEAFSDKGHQAKVKAEQNLARIEKLTDDALGEHAKYKELEDFLKNPPKADAE